MDEAAIAAASFACREGQEHHGDHEGTDAGGRALHRGRPELAVVNQRAMALMERFNASPAADGEARRRLLTELLGGIGEGSEIRPPPSCDYGTFINFGAMLLDVAPITIGDDCQIGPNVQFLTPTHPVDPGRAVRSGRPRS
jgi:acetyltransferase-like isoleucine patch superfamily enzyme